MNNDFYAKYFIFLINSINLNLHTHLPLLAWLFQLHKHLSTCYKFIGVFSHINKWLICWLSKVVPLFPSIDKIHNHITWTWSQVIVYIWLEILCFEFWFDCLTQAVPMIGDCCASRVCQRVDGKFEFVYELEKRLFKGAS